MRAIDDVERELRDWSQVEATCQEDYDHACQQIRDLTAERNWIRAGYIVQRKMMWFSPPVPCVRIVSFRADEAERIAGVPVEGEHFYAHTPESGTSMQGIVVLWPKRGK
jgi:hypothetical protein